MRRHSRLRQQQRDLADISSLLCCAVLSFLPRIPPFDCYPRFCFNSIPHPSCFLQGRHVALQRNGSHATDGSAKVPRYANKMQPIRSSCATLTTNTNWFVQSNLFVIFLSLLLLLLFLHARRQASSLDLFRIYFTCVSDFDALCSLCPCVLGYMPWCNQLRTHFAPFATVCVCVYAGIHKERKKENRLGNNQPTIINSHVGWVLLSGGKVYWLTAGVEDGSLREACLMLCTLAAQVDGCVGFLSLHEWFTKRSSNSTSARASWQVLILLATV